MNKILTGSLGLVVTMALTAGSAYALLSSQATVSGVSINSGTAVLKIGAGGGGPQNNVTNLPLPLNINVYPGLQTWIAPTENPLNLYNESSSNFNLSVKAQITNWSSSAGDWNVLADNVYVRAYSTIDNAYSNWVTLRTAHDAGMDLPGTAIPFGAYGSNKRGYALELLVDPAVGNGIAGANLQNIVITFTGTQVNP